MKLALILGRRGDNDPASPRCASQSEPVGVEVWGIFGVRIDILLPFVASWFGNYFWRWKFPEIGVSLNHPFQIGIFPNKNHKLNHHFWVPPFIKKKKTWNLTGFPRPRTPKPIHTSSPAEKRPRAHAKPLATTAFAARVRDQVRKTLKLYPLVKVYIFLWTTPCFNGKWLPVLR